MVPIERLDSSLHIPGLGEDEAPLRAEAFFPMLGSCANFTLPFLYLKKKKKLPYFFPVLGTMGMSTVTRLGGCGRWMAVLGTWRGFFLCEHPCREMVQLLSAAVSCWGLYLVGGEAGCGAAPCVISPALLSLHTPSNPGKEAAASRAGRLLVNRQSKNSRRVFASGMGEIIQTSLNGLHFFFFNSPAGSGEKVWRWMWRWRCSGGAGDAPVLRNRASRSSAHC